MPAAITDKIRKASNGTRPVPTTLTATRSVGAASISCGALTGWATDTAVDLIIYSVNTSGAKVAGSQTEWVGIVSGTTITNLVLKAGSDTGDSIGAVVEAAPTAAFADSLATHLLTQHAQDGTHAAITATSVVSSGVVTGTTVTGTSVVSSGDIQHRSISLETIRSELEFDYVASGGVWSGDSYGSTLNASMTAVVCYINGRRGTISAVTARAFTASKDTYVDILNNSGTFSLVYTEVANNAASPALAANSIRLGIIVSGANIAAVGSVNQGQEDKVLPIASSIPYAVTDSLGNLICPRDPNRKILGYRQLIGTFAATSLAAVTGLTVPVVVPTGRKIKITAHAGDVYNTTANRALEFSIHDGSVPNRIANTIYLSTSASQPAGQVVSTVTTPSASSKTYIAAMNNDGAGNATILATSTMPAYLVVELV